MLHIKGLTYTYRNKPLFNSLTSSTKKRRIIAILISHSAPKDLCLVNNKRFENHRNIKTKMKRHQKHTILEIID